MGVAVGGTDLSPFQPLESERFPDIQKRTNAQQQILAELQSACLEISQAYL